MQDLIGFILPPVIDLVNQKISNAKAKFWIAMAICMIIGTIVNLDKLNDLNGLLGSIAIIFAESQAVYKTYWGTSGARETLYPNRIE
jgi:hypothetical protein